MGGHMFLYELLNSEVSCVVVISLLLCVGVGGCACYSVCVCVLLCYLLLWSGACS